MTLGDGEDEIECTGTLTNAGGVAGAYYGELDCDGEGTAECYQVNAGAIMTRTTPGTDAWSDGGVVPRQITGPSIHGAGNWVYGDAAVCATGEWTATAWGGTGCKTFSSGDCTPSTVEICVVSCP